MRPNPQETADLITFTEEVLNGKLHILCSDSDFIFIDDNFNPKGHFIELADGTRSNNVAKERRTVVISLRTKEGNLVKATLENTLFIPTYHQRIFSIQTATQKGAKTNFNGSSAELVTVNANCFPIEQ